MPTRASREGFVPVAVADSTVLISRADTSAGAHTLTLKSLVTRASIHVTIKLQTVSLDGYHHCLESDEPLWALSSPGCPIQRH